MQKIKLMSHLVAGYPSDDVALTVASALVEGGAEILEVQLPFSDPSADGPAIQSACTKVLERKYKTQDGFNFIKTLRQKFPETKIFVMSYASLAFTPGINNFCKMARDCGTNGLIIPDLPFDDDEGLTQSCKENGMINIPVAAPSMAENRLYKMANAHFPYIYAALRTGITGSDTTVDDETLSFLKKVGSGGSKIYGGFGITNGVQSNAIKDYVDAVVAGSVFVRLITENQNDKTALFNAIKAKAKEISCISDK